MAATLRLLLMLAVARPSIALSSSRDLPVTSGGLGKVKGMIRSTLAKSQAALRADTTERDYCLQELGRVQGKLRQQGDIVMERLQGFEVALRAMDTETLAGRTTLRAGREAKVDAEMAVDRARRGVGMAASAADLLRTSSSSSFAQQASSSRGDPDAAEAKVNEAKYELKQQVDTLANLNKQQDVLHERCVASAGRKQDYEMRQRARQSDISSLTRAHELLDAYRR